MFTGKFTHNNLDSRSKGRMEKPERIRNRILETKHISNFTEKRIDIDFLQGRITNIANPLGTVEIRVGNKTKLRFKSRFLNV